MLAKHLHLVAGFFGICARRMAGKMVRRQGVAAAYGLVDKIRFLDRVEHVIGPFPVRLWIWPAAGDRHGEARCDPAIDDCLKGHGIEVEGFEPPLLHARDQRGLLQKAKMLHHPKPGHVELRLQLGQGLTAFVPQTVHNGTAGRVVDALKIMSMSSHWATIQSRVKSVT